MGVSTSQSLRVVTAVLGGTLAPAMAFAATASNVQDDGANLDEILVRGVRSITSDKIPDGVLNAPQTITVIPREVMESQATSRLEDALRNVPGITLNAGEGAARGDTVNLRGFPAYNDFFLDGIRDAAIYNRDSFNLEAVEVLKGPSAILFGRGSTGGAINQVSKAPTLAPIWAGTLVGGTNSEIRATADIDQPIGPNAAIRVNAMGEHSKVASRDNIRNRRWGIAPSISLGIGGPDQVTLSYLHQEENDIPDVGIPFLGDGPAPVSRNSDFGLKSDRFKATVNIGTLRYRHQFNANIDIANTTRYASYDYTNIFNAPNYGYFNNPGTPTTSTPLGSILVGRDAPASYGHRTNLTNQTDLNAHFKTGSISHTLVVGAEFGRERDNTVRLVNPFGGASETPATPLLDPDSDAYAAPQPGKSRAITTAYSTAAYITDTVHIGEHLDVLGGVRYDRFAAHYRPTSLITGVADPAALDHVDHVFSPRAAIIFKPSQYQRLYVSYGTSFDPSAEALSLSTKTADLGPVKAKSYEAGAKFDWLDGRLSTTAAIFRTQINNAQITDPDHPTALVLGGNQRVDGLELGVTGHLTKSWEIIAGYTYLDGKTVYSTTPAIVGKQLSNVARNAFNLWTEYDFSDKLEAGVGGNYLGKRYADFGEVASMPAYVIVNAMMAYHLNDKVTLRVNGNNIFNKLAWQNAYYSKPSENHVIPAPGRTVLFTAAVKY